ncbi:MAG TPA: toll/interleukin-1 receptor domain-containing protein, partial [Vicinamibacterales bacterium]|nr:toll/interleukin-1 receptor domain-containing protein [Vicinamibacterales bacterium]
ARMPATFISYRRDDAAGYAGRLHEALERRLGGDQIFRDIDTLEPGLDFVEAIHSRLRECRVFLALIGREWLDARDREGRRRLDQPHDYVRLEISAALARADVRVIPVLIEGATMPAPETLPEPLRALARRHAVNLRDDAWDHDVDRLAEVISGVTASAHPRQTSRGPGAKSLSLRRLMAVAAAVVALVVVMLFVMKDNDADVTTPSTAPPESAGAGASAASASSTRRYGVAIPAIAEVAHPALVYTPISANVTPLGNGTSELRLRMQFLNDGRYDANAWDAGFRLVLGGETLAPTGGLNELVPGRSLRQGMVVFTIPASATGKAVLRVLEGDRVGELPLDLSTTLRPAEDEREEVPDSLWRAITRSIVPEQTVLVRGSGLSVTVLRGFSRRFVNVVRLRFAIRYENSGQYAVATGAATLRLAAGGQVLAPIEEPSEVVDSRANRSADVVFEVPTNATRVTLRGFIDQASGEMPIDLK